MRSSKASAENMVLKIVGNLDFKPSESAIDRATSYVEGLLKKSGDLFKIVSDPIRMDKVRAKVIEILIVGSMAKENPRGVYTTYSAWRAAAKKAGAVRFEGDKDIAQAFDANGRGVAEWDGAEGYIYRKSEMRNPVKSRKENYTNFDDWEVDAFRAGATQVIRLGEDLFSAIKMKDGSLVKLDDEGYVDMRSRAGQRVRKESITVGAWYGDRGEIYRHLIKNNPRHRIAVRLSKSRQRNPLESGANISDDKDINFRASNMG